MKRAREKHEIVIGYKLRSDKRPFVNPPDKHVRKLTLATVEAIVVMSHMAVARACFHNDEHSSSPHGGVYHRRAGGSDSSSSSSTRAQRLRPKPTALMGRQAVCWELL